MSWPRSLALALNLTLIPLWCAAAEPERAPEPAPTSAPGAAPVRPAPPAPENPSARAITGMRAPGKKAPPGAREILLTFDDGPRPDLTIQVLDLLDARGIKAIFFVNGVRFMGKGRDAERARELMREMVRRGHLVGNHTVHHYFLCGKRGPTIAAQEIEDNAAAIEQVIGMRPLLFRTPYGAHCKTLSDTLVQLGIQPIGWDVDPQDWRLRDSARILAFMQANLKRVQGRSIVLFHDVQPATVAMLPKLLDWIDQENAAQRAARQPELRYIDYGFLLPDYPVIPPMLDGIARALLETVRSWPAPLAFLPGGGGG